MLVLSNEKYWRTIGMKEWRSLVTVFRPFVFVNWHLSNLGSYPPAEVIKSG